MRASHSTVSRARDHGQRRHRRSLGSQDVAAEGGKGDRLVRREKLKLRRREAALGPHEHAHASGRLRQGAAERQGATALVANEERRGGLPRVEEGGQRERRPQLRDVEPPALLGSLGRLPLDTRRPSQPVGV